MTMDPARVLGLDTGTLLVGARSNVTFFDPGEEWTLDVAAVGAKSEKLAVAGK